jgi:7,8-dihydroneopterin aldolase/epimerase/oxygenase
LKDKIFIKNLILPCKVGITEEERVKKQNVIFDIEIFCDLNRAGSTDDVDQTIDYYATKDNIAAMVTKGEFKLLESLAENVASIVLKKIQVSSVSVAVKKEKYSQNPVLGIEISRDRHG